MLYTRLFPRRAYLIRVTVLLAGLTSLFAAGSTYGWRVATSRTTEGFSATASCSPPCIENFDGVTAPALPTSWTANLATGQPGDLPWRTVNTSSDTSPNSAFANDPSHVTNNLLTSRTFPIVSSAVMTFSRRNNLELTYDGMVLEISIDGAAFTDILNAGSFVSGGYNFSISTLHGSPIAGRQAWTGDTGGFVTTQVNLSSSVIGRTVTFRWRVATDDSIASVGAFIDNITLTGLEPPNDNFVNAQIISGVSGWVNGSNVGATKEANEPNHAPGNAGGASVWYRWVAPNTGRFTFTTFRSSFNTLLAVYTGDSLPGLTEVASNDNATQDVLSPCFDRTSTVSFDAIGGVEYRIAVDRNSSDPAAGNIVLRWGRSASISGRITFAGGGGIPVSIIRLEGEHICKDNASFSPFFTFNDVPTGGSYSVFFQWPGATFRRWGTSESISPLTGDVSNFNYYQDTPTANIVGEVTMPGGDQSGLTVTCVSTPEPIVSAPAFFLGDDRYQCTALPVLTRYVVTPAKQGFTFSPASRTLLLDISGLFGVDFTGTVAPTYTISGLVTNSTGTIGLSGVAVALSGSQTAATITDASGNYSFTGVTGGGNYVVTPSLSGYTFNEPSHSVNNLSSNLTVNFTSTPTLATMQFSQGSFSVDEAAAGASITVSRGGNLAQAVSVDYTTSNGSAWDSTDYTIASGSLNFGAGETSKSFTILITDDGYGEGDEILNITLGNPVNATFGGPSTAALIIRDNETANSATNPIDVAEFFVRQHYYDFLNRLPDDGGLAYWTNQIASCGPDAACVHSRRIGVSAAYFVELEFQNTGNFVYRFYKATFGQRPSYLQFMTDRSRLVEGADLEASRRSFAEAWVQRPAFTARYSPSLGGAQFVDALIATVGPGSGVDLSGKRSELLAEYNLGAGQTDSRARTLRKLVEYPEFAQVEFNPSFVLAQYFGYLRRDPDQGGYDFWLNVLNNRVPGNFRGMVCAFLTSREYQERFGAPVTRTNQDCSSL